MPVKTGEWRECPAPLLAEIRRREGARIQQKRHIIRVASLVAAAAVLVILWIGSSISASSIYPHRMGFDHFRKEYEEHYTPYGIGFAVSRSDYNQIGIDVRKYLEDDTVKTDAGQLLRLQSLRERRSALVDERRALFEEAEPNREDYETEGLSDPLRGENSRYVLDFSSRLTNARELAEPLDIEIIAACREIHELENAILQTKRARRSHELRMQGLPLVLLLLGGCGALFVLWPRALQKNNDLLNRERVYAVAARCILKERRSGRRGDLFNSTLDDEDNNYCRAEFKTGGGTHIGPVNISDTVYEQLAADEPVVLASRESSEQQVDYVYTDLEWPTEL